MIMAPIDTCLNALSPVSEIVWDGLGNTEMHYILFDFFFMRKREISFTEKNKQIENKKNKNTVLTCKLTLDCTWY